MVLHPGQHPSDLQVVHDYDDYSLDGIATPTGTLASNNPFDEISDPQAAATEASITQPLLVPWPGSTYILRAVSSGHVLTLTGGRVALASPGNGGSIHWQCEEHKGWLGFKNTTSGKYLGHDKPGKLCCEAGRMDTWEFFAVRPRPGGGCILLLTHWERLWHVGIMLDKGVERLAKIGEGGGGGIVWEFVEV